MNKNSMQKFRYRAVAVAAAALALGSVVTTATTAQAAPAEGWVDGWDNVTDDWGDEGVLSTTQHANSGATGVWQTILYNDGFLNESDIDCKFGPATAEATRKWQAKYLGASQADGVVGPKTFGKASSWLNQFGWGSGFMYINYDGAIDHAKTRFFMRDYATGRYSFYNLSGVRVEAYYDSMDRC
ncbi:peptidoglycan-binding protein [Streptomyces sp. NPDC097981]|uniref:peptidoglycan-binding domain-containing protein n=1 Tax=Streptomyces sp. NPDC097981 TaxID=3155428 RepID=UPI003330F907